MIGERIKIARGNMTQKDFALEIGVHKMTLGKYETGKVVPGGDVLARIIKKTDIEAHWLLTGEGPMLRGSVKPSPSDIDIETLQSVLEAVEEILEEEQLYLSPHKKSDLVASLYNLYSDSEMDADPSKIIRFVKLVG